MAPEYGATIGFFPVDEQVLSYMRLTGRPPEQIDLVERYSKEQGLWRQKKSEPAFTEVLELDLGTVVPSIAGPRRPQDRVELRGVKNSFRSSLVDVFHKEVGESATPRLDRWSAEAPVAASTASAGVPQTAVAEQGLPAGGKTTPRHEGHEAATVEHLRGQKASAIAEMDEQWVKLTHGDVVIAAITSCTNTSNPSVMIAAGLLAKKAVERGLKVPPLREDLAEPGQPGGDGVLQPRGAHRVPRQARVPDDRVRVHDVHRQLRPAPEAIAGAVDQADLVVCSVLSGNRNFEGRINPHVKANYLASPPLVVAYAIAGTMDINIMDEPLAKNDKGEKVYLKDIWPTQQEVNDTIQFALAPYMFQRQYANVAEGNQEWNAIPVHGGELFEWDEQSTYIQEPPFFKDLAPEPKPIQPIAGARVLAMVGHSVTTDHISPAGSIKQDSPAGRFLQEHKVPPVDFNSYGSRRGDYRVMTRGTFANIRLRNELAPGTEGGVTKYLEPGQPDGEVTSIFEASERYQQAGVPLIVLAGKDYGMGSSRDWAAKGVYLLGVKAVIAESFERIHRSNLVGMGVLPLQFQRGQSRTSLGLTGTGTFEILVGDDLKPLQEVTVRVTNREGAAGGIQGRLPHRHAGGTGVLPQRRHPPHRAAEHPEGHGTRVTARAERHTIPIRESPAIAMAGLCFRPAFRGRGALRVARPRRSFASALVFARRGQASERVRINPGSTAGSDPARCGGRGPRLRRHARAAAART
jgi:aconitate hydratase